MLRSLFKTRTAACNVYYELDSNRIKSRLNCHYILLYFEYVHFLQTKYDKYDHVN